MISIQNKLYSDSSILRFRKPLSVFQFYLKHLYCNGSTTDLYYRGEYAVAVYRVNSKYNERFRVLSFSLL